MVGQAIRLVLEKEGKADDPRRQFVFLSSREADLCDYEATRSVFEKYAPTHVIHLAAMVGGLFKNMKYKVEFFVRNNAINENVLRCCHEFKVKKCVRCAATLPTLFSSSPCFPPLSSSFFILLQSSLPRVLLAPPYFFCCKYQKRPTPFMVYTLY